MSGSDTSAARHVMGHALGAASGSCLCAFCGRSPFAAARPTKTVCGPAFVDYDLLIAADAPDVCAGCVAMVGGKPSKENPPLRMGHIAVINGVLERPDGARLVGLLTDPPPSLEVLCWTNSRQRHASLRAGLCGDSVLYIGTESGTIEWTEQDVALLDAVSVLRAHARQDHIATGQYPPHVIVALGASWSPAEAVVARYRPSLLLDMVVAIVRRPPPSEDDPMPIADPQRNAAELLLLLSDGSADRKADPIRYWSTLLMRRLAAACGRGRDLAEVSALLMESTTVNPLSSDTVDAVARIEEMDDEDAASVVQLWHTQPRIIIALTRIIKDERYND